MFPITVDTTRTTSFLSDSRPVVQDAEVHFADVFEEENLIYKFAVLPSGSVFTEKLCIQSFLKMWLCFGSVKPSKLTKSLYLLIETTLDHLNLQYFK